MKLIELLVKELPKRGGWPRNAYTAKSYCHIPDVSFWDEDGVTVPYFPLSNRPIGVDCVTREQYDGALAAAQQLAWDGEGLPPVGCECEISHLTEYSKARINYISADNVVFSVLYINGSKEELCWTTRECSFRPIRSEADKNRDYAVGAMERYWEAATDKPAYAFESIYYAIAAGKIPGITKTPTVSELMRVTENATREDCEAILKMMGGDK